MKRKDKIVLYNVEIESVAAEGNALARVDGKVLFVPHCIPGDVVDVRLTRKRSGYMEGMVVNMVKPSPLRLEPFCSHYGTCGGCKWQALPYKMQLEYKQQQVEDQLRRIGHLELPELSPILGSEKSEFYRNKLEFTFSNRRWIERDEEPDNLTTQQWMGLGFHIGGFFDKVLDIKKCYLQPEPSNEIRNFIREFAFDHGYSFYDLRANQGFLRTMIVRTSSTGEVMLIVVFGEENKEQREELLQAIKSNFPIITSLYYVINLKCNDTISDQECILYSGNEAIYEEMEDLKFKIGPKSFYQTNSDQAYRLYSVVRDYAKRVIPQDGEKPVIYDLYTGTGTIALFLSKLASKVVGIEYVPEAIEDAKNNARFNGIENSKFYAGDMKDVLNKEFIKENGKPDLVVLDPPRAGIHPDVAKVLMEAYPTNIIYVSCNPASQARDLAIFSSFYSIEAVQPVDMFPHTHHVENVVLLKKK